MLDGLSRKKTCLGSRDFFRFREMSDYISEMVQNRNIDAMEDNRKSHVVACGMAPLPVTFSDF